MIQARIAIKRLGRAACALAAGLLLWPTSSAAQHMPLRYYTQQEGLANLTVTALAQSRDGYLWAGTDNGLFRYNGAAFQRYAQDAGLNIAYVTALLVDQEDRLWLGSADRLYLKVGERLQPVLAADGRQLPVRPGQTLFAGPGGARYAVSDGRLYQLALRAGQPQAQAVFSAAHLARYPELAALRSVYAERADTLWMGCGSALCQSGPGGVTRWGAAQGVPDDDWRAILRDRGGQLWAHGDKHIIALAPRADRFVERTPAADALRKVKLRPALAEDALGRILATVDDGLVRWDGSRWERFGPANGLRTAGGLNALLVDPSGSLWMGSRGLGLINWLGYGNWENWTRAQGLPDDVALSFVRERGGALYAGTRAGLARLAPDARHFAPAGSGDVQQWSSLALDADGKVWGATLSGQLMQVDGSGKASTRADHLPRISQLLADSQQRLWLASDGGIYQAGSDRQVARLAGAAGERYNAICQMPGGGAVWFLAQRRLLRLAGTDWTSYATYDAMGGTELYVFSCAADGTLWLADVKGRLWRASAGAKGLQLTRVEGAPLNGAAIYGLHEDKRGWLWVGTDAGIAVWNRTQWRFFNQNDGLIWNDSNGRVFYEDADGSMWIATSNGISHLRQPALLFAPQQLSVRLESARHDGQALAPDQAWRLPWSAAALEMTLVSPHFQQRKAVRFHYRLAGLESRWSASANPTLRYAALPPGEYQLEFYASNGHQHSASPLQRHALTVLPPWWRSLPAYLACAALAALSLAALHRLRVRQLLLRQRHTDQLVRARTLELEQSREQLRARALKDSLTSVWNRGAILEIAEGALQQASAQRSPLLLVLLDLDHFKKVNDTHGHAAGDAVLKETVLRLSAVVRLTDSVGRYGGEEFLVLLPGLDWSTGQARVEALRRAIELQPIAIGAGQAISVTGSFGVIAYEPGRPLPLAELIAQADLALYRSKKRGRNRVEYADRAA